MKIAIFTPTHAKSAIGRVTSLVRGALQSAGHDVPLVSTQVRPLKAGDVNPDLIDSVLWTDENAVRQIVSESDLVLHQIGDHYEFHAGSVHWLPLVGGCIALHDFFLGDMFLSWIRGHENEAETVLRRWYGLSLEEYIAFAQSGRFVDLTWPEYPLTEWLSSYADGIIVHSGFGLAAVDRSTNAPSIVVPLPYDLEDAPEEIAPNGFGDGSSRALRILTFGRINPNKLSDDVILAIASDQRLRERVEYRICGTIQHSEREYLVSLARSLGVNLDVTGEITQAQLVQELQFADLIVCARNPTLESASASAVEAMLSGTPLIVLDQGFYSSLPSECVFHVSPFDIHGGMKRTLQSILGGKRDLDAMGFAAREYATSTFRADTYASELVELGIEAARRRPLRELDSAFVALRQDGIGDVAPVSREIYDRDTLIFRP